MIVVARVVRLAGGGGVEDAARTFGRRSERMVNRGGLLRTFFAGVVGLLPFGRPLSFGSPPFGGGDSFLQAQQPVDRHAEQSYVVFGWTGPRLDGDQEQADHGHVDLQRHAAEAFGEKVVEVSMALQPAEEQLDLPAVLVDQSDHPGGQVETIGQQAQELGLALAVDEVEFDQPQGRQFNDPALSPAQLNDGVTSHACGTIRVTEETFFHDIGAGRLAQSDQKVAVGVDDVLEEAVVLKAAIHDEEAVGAQALPELFSLAALSIGECHMVRQAVQDVELDVHPHVALAGVVENGPGDTGGHGQEAAVHRQELAGDLVESGVVGLDAGPLAEIVDEREQQLGIEDALRVGNGALAHGRQSQTLTHLRVLEDVLNRPQAADLGIEERDEVGDDQMIQKDVPITMRRLGVEMPELILDQPNELTADDVMLRAGHRLQIRRGFVATDYHGAE